MTPAPKKPSFFKNFLIWFIVFYIAIIGYNHFFGEKDIPEETPQDVIVKTVKDDYTVGNLVNVQIQNNLTTPIHFPSPCGKNATDSLNISFVTQHREEIIRSNISDDILKECTTDQIADFTVPAESAVNFVTKDFNHELFVDEGDYEITMKFQTENSDTLISATSEPVEIENPGIFKKLFRALIFQPLFNILVALTQYMPGHSYGWAIVILTLAVRLLLFVPNQKAMRSQREMQKLQPKIAEIKEQNKDNQQVVAMKTMELYKTHKVNPMGSLLPILLQMPFLLGIFYLIKDGISPHLSYLLYGFYEHANLAAGDPSFFGLNLGMNKDGNGTGQIVLAALLAVTQFVAVKLSMYQAKKRQEKDGDNTKPTHKKNDPMAAAQNAGKVMMWIMPAMVAVFSVQLPAGVGIYWLTSTIFGIGQQRYVNYKLDQPQVTRKK